MKRDDAQLLKPPGPLAASVAQSRHLRDISTRPAVESALMAAQVILDAAGDYRQCNLEPYIGRLTHRFGKRNSGNAAASLLPQQFREKLAATLMATRWFARHVVIERWFLHHGQPAILAR